jgi:hypothetical protein
VSKEYHPSGPPKKVGTALGRPISAAGGTDFNSRASALRYRINSRRRPARAKEKLAD